MATHASLSHTYGARFSSRGPAVLAVTGLALGLVLAATGLVVAPKDPYYWFGAAAGSVGIAFLSLVVVRLNIKRDLDS